ncbi:MAG: hypothetical protein M3081_16210 [Gemmatimonadota bacterium]|nr:hypothetical protein [Gemmatimonadota bacterium]
MKLLPDGEKHRGGFLASVVLHIALGAVLIWVLSLPYPFSKFLSRDHGATIPVERISFLKLPDKGTTTAGRSGGNDRAIVPPPPEPRIVAPVATPRDLPRIPENPIRLPEVGTGPIVGRGGPVQGVTPSYHDSPLWATPGDVPSAPKTAAERLDSSLTSRIAAHNDTVAAYYAGHKLDRGDWTFERGGKKYGLDSTGLYLGGIRIPSMLLPHAIGNNAERNAQSRAIAMMNQEVREQTQHAMNEEEFRQAVKRIRERKERERREGTQVLTP